MYARIGRQAAAENAPLAATGWFASGYFLVGIVDEPSSLWELANRNRVDAKMKARLADLGGITLTGSPVDFGKLIVEETEKWAKVVKLSGAKLD
jgi:predicted metal-binding membrane protein